MFIVLSGSSPSLIFFSAPCFESHVSVTPTPIASRWWLYTCCCGTCTSRSMLPGRCCAALAVATECDWAGGQSGASNCGDHSVQRAKMPKCRGQEPSNGVNDMLPRPPGTRKLGGRGQWGGAEEIIRGAALPLAVWFNVCAGTWGTVVMAAGSVARVGGVPDVSRRLDQVAIGGWGSFRCGRGSSVPCRFRCTVDGGGRACVMSKGLFRVPMLRGGAA